MARPRKLSEEELFNIIERYLIDNPYIVSLKFSELASYSQELGYNDVTYQDFSRNKEIKKFVDEFKKQKKMTMYSKLNNDKLEKLEFNVDDVVDKNIKDKKQLKVILKVFKMGYDKAFDKLLEIGKDIKELKNKIIEQNNVIEELKEKNKLLRMQMKENEERYSRNKKKEKEKWIYLTIKDLINETNFSIKSEEQIINIMKNLGYDIKDDIIDMDNIINNEFKNIEYKENENKEIAIKDNAEKVISLHKKDKKLDIPDFMK
ncbi:hypothetical protein [Clostridium beijerinckii]|uniref:Organic radical activating enzyme n=1 Tax=Clostridium beijerinckii TaxID=1520 RepID=A0AAE5LRE7_CLOBE|nr:hypothetical protein [Clostridium beijerinckii]NSB15665.1 organic radical activating enzyme [Clostridium beijerinckii]OOM33527.1 hypothetical protein CLOBE_05550 [Clostridium beijerinckii]